MTFLTGENPFGRIGARLLESFVQSHILCKESMHAFSPTRQRS
jgi:hypothetical protein